MVTATDRRATQLERRRDQAASAAAAADKAQKGVTELDNRLETNTSMTRQQTQALRNAATEVNRLKRALKAGAKERARLTKARKQAQSRAAKSQAKAEAAETRYDETVLAEIVHRAKERDRADAGKPSLESTSRVLEPVPDQAAVPAEATATPTRRRATKAAAKPAAGTATATRTAARKTAASARRRNS